MNFLTEISELIQQLGDRNTKVRLDAANQLARRGTEAIEAVTKMLDHQDYTLRRIAAYILGKIGNPDSVEVLFIKELMIMFQNLLTRKSCWMYWYTN